MLEHFSHGLGEMAVHDRHRHAATHFYPGVPRSDAGISSMVDLQGEERRRARGSQEGRHLFTLFRYNERKRSTPTPSAVAILCSEQFLTQEKNTMRP